MSPLAHATQIVFIQCNSSKSYEIPLFLVSSVFVGQACTIMILNFWTDRSGQTVQPQIRLLLEEQSDQGLRCLLFHLHVFDKIPSVLASLVAHLSRRLIGAHR